MYIIQIKKKSFCRRGIGQKRVHQWANMGTLYNIFTGMLIRRTTVRIITCFSYLITISMDNG